MARKNPLPPPEREAVLECVHQSCPACGGAMWNKYDNYRTVRTLREVVQLRLKIRRCVNPECERFHQAYRPEQESRWALPQHEFGLDVIALIGALRYQDHRVRETYLKQVRPSNEAYLSESEYLVKRSDLL